MRLAVDANILVAGLLQRAGRALLADSRLELYVADAAWEETERHLRRRVVGMVASAWIPVSMGEVTFQEALIRGRRNVTIVPEPYYQAEQEVARRRMPHDETDWPTIAVALSIGGDIWTEDRHFHGCGVACWTTETLRRELAALPAA